VRCRECRSLFDESPRSKEEMAEIYEGRQYFVKADEPGATDLANGYADDYLADREFIEAKFDQVLAHLERYVSPGRLLDVGAGPGFLLSVAERRGWAVVGVDLNKWAAEYAEHELGVQVHVGELTEDLFDAGSFDAITMMDMIEHVPDASEVLRLAARLVRPGGAIALLTPDAGSPVSRALGRRWPEVQMPGEHPLLFSRRGLEATLGRHGFVPASWHTVGKTALVSTLLADMAAAAPRLATRVRDAVSDRPLGRRVVDLDPHTKFCMYARRADDGVEASGHHARRVPKRVGDEPAPS
jgi:SAM-dependent methyltransferase